MNDPSWLGPRLQPPADGLDTLRRRIRQRRTRGLRVALLGAVIVGAMLVLTPPSGPPDPSPGSQPTVRVTNGAAIELHSSQPDVALFLIASLDQTDNAETADSAAP